MRGLNKTKRLLRAAEYPRKAVYSKHATSQSISALLGENVQRGESVHLLSKPIITVTLQPEALQIPNQSTLILTTMPRWFLRRLSRSENLMLRFLCLGISLLSTYIERPLFSDGAWDVVSAPRKWENWTELNKENILHDRPTFNITDSDLERQSVVITEMKGSKACVIWGALEEGGRWIETDVRIHDDSSTGILVLRTRSKV